MNGLIERFGRLPPQVADGLLGVAFLGFGIAGLYGPIWIEQPYRDADALGFALLGLQTLPLAWRRVRPGAVLAVIGFGTSLYLVLEYLPTNAMLAVLVAIYSFAAHSDRYRKLAIAGIVTVTAFVFLGGRFYAERAELTWELIMVNAAIFAAAWLMGDNVRVRREQASALEDRAQRLERDRDERARRAVAEERARIARELHDVVAHNVSVMVVQAGAARRQATNDPDRAAETVGAIERVGRQALNDMRRLLGVLRTDDEAEQRRAPQPGLAQVDALVEELRTVGVAVSLSVEGAAREVPPGLDLTAYRIVQEALTNVLKHAGPAGAEVTLRYSEHDLEIEVVDDGRGAASDLRAPADAGQGLVGMRERVALYGGELDAGPRPGGGYRIHARLRLAGGTADDGDSSHDVRGAGGPAGQDVAARIDGDER